MGEDGMATAFDEMFGIEINLLGKISQFLSASFLTCSNVILFT
jgi:hypothetical protein